VLTRDWCVHTRTAPDRLRSAISLDRRRTLLITSSGMATRQALRSRCQVGRSGESARRQAAQGPSPPEAVQERGSQRASGSTDPVGALNAPLAGVVVVVDGVVVVAEADPWLVVVVAGEVVVGLTEN